MEKRCCDCVFYGQLVNQGVWFCRLDNKMEPNTCADYKMINDNMVCTKATLNETHNRYKFYLVSSEQAVALTELGFGEPCTHAYYIYEEDGGEMELVDITNEKFVKSKMVYAPSILQAVEWLAETFGHVVKTCVVSRKQGLKYVGMVETDAVKRIGEFGVIGDTSNVFGTYSDAMLHGIDMCLDIVKKQNNGSK